MFFAKSPLFVTFESPNGQKTIFSRFALKVAKLPEGPAEGGPAGRVLRTTVEMLEDEGVLQTTTYTPRDIDKDPEGWKVAFQAELDSFDPAGSHGLCH